MFNRNRIYLQALEWRIDDLTNNLADERARTDRANTRAHNAELELSRLRAAPEYLAGKVAAYDFILDQLASAHRVAGGNAPIPIAELSRLILKSRLTASNTITEETSPHE